ARRRTAGRADAVRLVRPRRRGLRPGHGRGAGRRRRAARGFPLRPCLPGWAVRGGAAPPLGAVRRPRRVLGAAGPAEQRHRTDRRRCLPLVGLSVLVVLAVLAVSQTVAAGAAVPEAAGLLLGLPVAAVLGYLTFQRNTVYESPEALWESVVAARPANAVAKAT